MTAIDLPRISAFPWIGAAVLTLLLAGPGCVDDTLVATDDDAGDDDTGDDDTGDDDTGDDDSGDDDSGDDDSGDDDSGDDDTTGDDDACSLLCGQVAVPDDRVGVGSFSPPGCGGGDFSYFYGYFLLADAAKHVPVLEDMDADGDLDLVANPRLVDGVLVFPGSANGAFAAPIVLPGAGGGWGGDVGDFDGDGQPDIIVGDHEDGGVAWTNDGGLAFTADNAGLPGNGLQGVGLVDLNGDGYLDAIFGADQFSTGFTIRHGDSAGGWTEPVVTGIPGLGQGGGSNHGWFHSADLDLDGDLDIVAFGQDYFDGQLFGQVFLNDGDGASFTHSADLPIPGEDWIGGPIQGAVGDVNCDGYPDIAVGGQIWFGDGLSWTEGPLVSLSHISQLGDLDGDGALDIVTHDTNQALTAFLNDGTGQVFTEVDLGLPFNDWESPALPAGPDHPLNSAYGIDLVDVNGDGRLDIVRGLTSKTLIAFMTYETNTALEVWFRDGP